MHFRTNGGWLEKGAQFLQKWFNYNHPMKNWFNLKINVDFTR